MTPPLPDKNSNLNRACRTVFHFHYRFFLLRNCRDRDWKEALRQAVSPLYALGKERSPCFPLSFFYFRSNFSAFPLPYSIALGAAFLSYRAQSALPILSPHIPDKPESLSVTRYPLLRDTPRRGEKGGRFRGRRRKRRCDIASKMPSTSSSYFPFPVTDSTSLNSRSQKPCTSPPVPRQSVFR